MVVKKVHLPALSPFMGGLILYLYSQCVSSVIWPICKDQVELHLQLNYFSIVETKLSTFKDLFSHGHHIFLTKVERIYTWFSVLRKNIVICCLNTL